MVRIGTPIWSKLTFNLKTSKKGVGKTKQEDYESTIQLFNAQKWTLPQLADHLINNVFDANLVDAKKKESPHYQALNTEHLGGGEVGGTKRLEVRRVPAQPNKDA